MKYLNVMKRWKKKHAIITHPISFIYTAYSGNNLLSFDQPLTGINRYTKPWWIYGRKPDLTFFFRTKLFVCFLEAIVIIHHNTRIIPMSQGRFIQRKEQILILWKWRGYDCLLISAYVGTWVTLHHKSVNLKPENVKNDYYNFFPFSAHVTDSFISCAVSSRLIPSLWVSSISRN